VFGTRTHVGYYAGDAPGPIERASAIVPHLRSHATVLSTAELRGRSAHDAVRLSSPELPAAGALPTRAPETIPPSLGAAGAAELVAWVERTSPDLLLVDGPSDVALFAHLTGVPVVTVRRRGRRPEAQRQLLDRAVLGILAPFTADLDAPEERSDPRTVHVGLLSRFAGRRRDRDAARRDLGVAPRERLVTVLGGRQGVAVSRRDLAAAASSSGGWRWHLLGETSSRVSPQEAMRSFGWVDDPWPHLTAADVVVAGASPSAVAEVADAGVPLLVVPAPSPDREERRFADALAAAGAAVPLARWPASARWADTLEAAARMDPGPLRSRCDGHAASRAAEWLDAWASMPVAQRIPEPAPTDDLDPLLGAELGGGAVADGSR
jgi:UDP-N-acetylglucosamine--N-acetylmuramyl-(pentapeptide) pyrophosphoryl-undecaprenol N-acetylglucosamine transferase